MIARRILHIASITVMLGFTAGLVHADTITLASVGTAADPGQTNSNGNTITLNPDSAWAASLPGSSWVSFTNTANPNNGGAYVMVPNGTIVDFYDTFNIAGTADGGSITVMADDTTSVYLNGVLLEAAATSTGNTYAICSDFAIGCRSATALTINLPANLFVTGQNTLEFGVEQEAGSSFGLDYSGSVDPTAIPEPSSLLMLCGGILSLAAFRKKRL